jgi:hypothetical protein
MTFEIYFQFFNHGLSWQIRLVMQVYRNFLIIQNISNFIFQQFEKFSNINFYILIFSLFTFSKSQIVFYFVKLC